MRVLFWGTPTFSLPSLQALGEEGHRVVGVVTQPDRPAGRGRKTRASPVRAAAAAEGYTILDPAKPRGDEFLGSIAALEPEISVVVAYGHILRREILDVPSQGSVNVHASLLPELRGAAPVNWAIVRGYDSTGVTIMRMSEGMDAGPILFQQPEPILPGETASELYDRLAEVGAGALVTALGLLENGLLDEQEQDHDRATLAPKLSRADARVDWNQTPNTVGNHIRGMDSIPGAWTEHVGEPVKVFRPETVLGTSRTAPGTVVDANAEWGLAVACAGGILSIGEVQPAGKKRMSALDWIRGRGVESGQRFE